MIKVSVLYPNSDGARFDHDYYRDQHVPMVVKELAGTVRSWGVERGVSDGSPDGAAPFVGSCWFVADSLDAWAAAFGAKSEQILGDIPNYTDIAPVMQIAEITAEG